MHLSHLDKENKMGMSKVIISTNLNFRKQVGVESIPKGTYFIGLIENFPLQGYQKGDRYTVMALNSGTTRRFVDLIVRDYTVCDVKITLIPRT